MANNSGQDKDGAQRTSGRERRRGSGVIISQTSRGLQSTSEAGAVGGHGMRRSSDRENQNETDTSRGRPERSDGDGLHGSCGRGSEPGTASRRGRRKSDRGARYSKVSDFIF